MVRSVADTNMCFDVKNYNMDNGNPIQLISCKDVTAQKFRFDSRGNIRNIINPNKCIEAGIAGTLYQNLFIYDCNGKDWQRWYRYADGRIKNAHHGKYIGLSWCRTRNESPIELRWREHGSCGNTQKWRW